MTLKLMPALFDGALHTIGATRRLLPKQTCSPRVYSYPRAHGHMPRTVTYSRFPNAGSIKAIFSILSASFRYCQMLISRGRISTMNAYISLLLYWKYENALSTIKATGLASSPAMTRLFAQHLDITPYSATPLAHSRQASRFWSAI